MIVLCSVNNREAWCGLVYGTTAQPITGAGIERNLDFLAPTWELVKGHKYEGKSDAWYVEGYRALLASRWKVEVKPWLMGLTPDEDMTLLCYCRQGKFCHRQLLAQMVAKWRPDLKITLL